MPFIFARPGAGTDALNAMPTLANGGFAGDWVTLVNRGTGILVVQDDGALPGSKLKLRSDKLTLAPGGALQLVWDGTYWVEQGRSTSSGLGLLHVDDYGAVGDGVTDDGPALQAAFDDAHELRLPLDLGGKTYRTNQQLTNAGIIIRGKYGAQRSIIQAGAVIDSVMRVDDQTVVTDVEFWGGKVARHCIDMKFSSYSRFQGVVAYQALVDGFHLSNDGGGNDAVILRDCRSELCGIIFKSAARVVPSSGCQRIAVSGTITTTSGSGNLVGVGTHFLTELANVRTGDFIAVGTDHTDTEWFMIFEVVDDTHITGHNLWPSARSAGGFPYAVFVGDGYHEDIGNEQNNNIVEHFLSRNNAGAGLAFKGIYGPVCSNLQIDANGAFPVVVGQSGLVAPFCSDFCGVYIEAFDEIAPAAFWIGNVNGIDIRRVIFGGPTIQPYNESLGPVRVTNELNTAGLLERAQGGFYGAIPQQVLLVPNAEPANGVLGTSQGTVWVDQVAKKLYVKVLLSDGVSYKNVEIGTYP